MFVIYKILKMKKAILFGASGFVGSYLLTNLLENELYSEVTIVVRKPLNIQHTKLNMVLADYRSLAQNKEYLVADDVFIALGTTKKKTPDEKEYYQIDHDYPLLAAELTKANGSKMVSVVSAIGANANSSIFYVKTKGEMEKDIIDVGFEHTQIFRPSIIMGSRAESRPLEKVFIKLFSAVNFLIPSRYKGITAQNIAKAMFNAAQKTSKKIEIFHWKEMQPFLK